MFINKSQKDENKNEAGVVYPVVRRSVTGEVQQKSFSSTDEFSPAKVMKLYSRRMQIEQNFRDEKSERFGFGLRGSHSRTEGRIRVLSLLVTLETVVLWQIGYHAENKGLHLSYQANSVKSRRVLSFLILAENILRHSPLILTRMALSTILTHLARTRRNMVLVY